MMKYYIYRIKQKLYLVLRSIQKACVKSLNHYFAPGKSINFFESASYLWPRRSEFPVSAAVTFHEFLFYVKMSPSEKERIQTEHREFTNDCVDML